MKLCTCGGNLQYQALGPGRIGYKCDKCGLELQKKPKMNKGNLTRIWKEMAANPQSGMPDESQRSRPKSGDAGFICGGEKNANHS